MRLWDRPWVASGSWAVLVERSVGGNECERASGRTTNRDAWPVLVMVVLMVFVAL